MAVEKPTSASVEARRLDVSILPLNFSIPLTDFLVGQNDDISNVAAQANKAADGAYIAQLTNEEQNIVLTEHTEELADHDRRLISAETTLKDHELRITSAESAIAVHETRIYSLEVASADHETRIYNIESDYVSKSVVASQTLASPINVATSYSINGTKVVGARQVGWVAAGGTVSENIGTWNPNILAAASAAYVQAEASEVRQQLNAAEARIKAIEQMARSHGLID